MSTETDRTTLPDPLPGPSESVRENAGSGRRLGALPVVEPNAPRAVLERDAYYRRLLAIADMGSAAGALLLVVAVAPDVQLSIKTLFALPGIVLVAKLLGLYDRDDLLLRKTTLEEAPQLFQLATLFAFGAWLAAPIAFSGYLNRGSVVGLLALVLFLLVATRGLARRLARRLSLPERCLFIGDAGAGERFAAKLEQDPGTKAHVVARVGFGASEAWRRESGAHQIEAIRELLESHEIHRVVLAPSTTDPAESLDVVRLLKAVGVRVSLLPHLFEAIGSSVVFDDIEGMTLLGVRRLELTRSSYMLKRSTDLVGATLAIILTLPAWFMIALVIRIDSRGSVFFRQERIGRGGDPFRMFKFRTMHHEAEAAKFDLAHRNEGADGFFKITNDPRVTSVGGWLRRSSLDELPQLLNVLRGEMSLVGPRPLIHEEDRQILGWQRRRLDLTPGMTGHWQILGSSRVPMSEMVAIDYLYVANWSLWNDVKILLRTLPYVARRQSR